jgi:general stress protein 26
MNEETKKMVLDFLHQDEDMLGVVSTISSDNKPESAFVYYSFDEDLNIYFMTRANSRKGQNILENKNVAYAIVSRNPPQTLQLDGEASFVDEKEMQKKLFKELVEFASKNYFASPIAQMQSSELVFIKITPHWMRFGNFEARRHGDMFEQVV